MKSFLKSCIIFFFIVILAGCTENKSLKVMSFNIRLSPNDEFDGQNSWLHRKDATIKMIETESPDVFGVQEAIYRQADYLDKHLTGYTKYGVDREGGLEKGEAESCAVFYKKKRFKLLKSGTFWLSETPEVPSRGWDAACHRVVTWVHLKERGLSGEELFFLNTHFDHKGEVARMESSVLTVLKIKEMVPDGVPIVLVGDFNCTIDDTPMIPLKRFMENARTTSPITADTGTFNNWGNAKEGNIIDHIFYKGVIPKSYRVVTENYGVPFISDHYPIVCEF